MRTLWSLCPELVLLTIALVAIGRCLLLPAPSPIRATDSALEGPWHAMDALLAHSRNFADREGYPATFAPIEAQLESLGLPLATQYWRYRRTLTVAEVQAMMPWPRLLSGSQTELDNLVRYVAPRVLKAPGDMVYIPLPSHGVTEAGSRLAEYNDCIFLVFDYPPIPYRQPEASAEDGFPLFSGATRMEEVQDRELARLGPYVAIKPLIAVPPIYEQFYPIPNGGPGSGVMLRQQGGQFSLQIQP